MSQENVELVRHVWEINVSEGAEAVLGYFTDDCVLEDFPDLPDHAVYIGKQGVLEIGMHWSEMWGEFVQEPVEFIDAGDEIVVAMVAIRVEGKGSGVPLDSQVAWVHELRDGKLSGMRAFTTKAEALEAAGLTE